MAGIGGVYVVAVVVIQEPVRTFRHAPCVVGQFREALARRFSVVPGIALQVFVDIQKTFVSAPAPVRELLDPFASAVGGMGVVDAYTQAVVGVGGLIPLPVRAFHQTVRLVVDVLPAFLLPGLRDAVAAQVVGIRIRLILAHGGFYITIYLCDNCQPTISITVLIRLRITEFSA